MTYNEKQKEWSMNYAKKALKRIPLDVQIPFYNEIKSYADKNGETVNGFIKRAIAERIDREG